MCSIGAQPQVGLRSSTTQRRQIGVEGGPASLGIDEQASPKHLAPVGLNRRLGHVVHAVERQRNVVDVHFERVDRGVEFTPRQFWCGPQVPVCDQLVGISLDCADSLHKLILIVVEHRSWDMVNVGVTSDPVELVEVREGVLRYAELSCDLVVELVACTEPLTAEQRAALRHFLEQVVEGPAAQVTVNERPNGHRLSVSIGMAKVVADGAAAGDVGANDLVVEFSEDLSSQLDLCDFLPEVAQVLLPTRQDITVGLLCKLRSVSHRVTVTEALVGDS